MKVLFFGDSVCTAQYVPLYAGWVAKISRTLEGSAVVECSAVNGRTTRQALEVLEFEVTHAQPDIVVVQLGMNDCNYWQTSKGLPRVSQKSFEGNMEEIINRLFALGVRRVLVNTNHVTARTEEKMEGADITYQESNEQYNQIIREVVDSYKGKLHRPVLQDMEGVFKDYGDVTPLLLGDGLHLSTLGHDLYRDAILPELVTEIRRLG